MNDSIPAMEKIILKGLISKDEFAREITAYIKNSYFETHLSKSIFESFNNYFTKYNSAPDRDYFNLELETSELLSDTQVSDGKEIIEEIYDCDISKYEDKWFREETEKWCQERALINAVMDSISIIDGSDKKQSTHAIPDMMRQALGVTFDSSVGHDYVEDYGDRFEFYHDTQQKFAFDIEHLNLITKGGVSRKTLNVIIAQTAGGKSQLMCHMAAAYAKDGLNVLYITCEMEEMRIAERLDANLMNVDIADIIKMDAQKYCKEIEKVNKKITGRIIMKEYPTASATVNHIRQLLQECKLKKNFIPDVIFVDYLNIMASARYSGSSNVNSYTTVKAIAEELRGLAQEENVVMWTATQTNRDGIDSSDLSLSNTSESIGLPQTADLMFALIPTEELEGKGQVLVKQLKNRYNSVSEYRKFIIGVERSKMKFYSVMSSAQYGIHDSGNKDDDEDMDGYGHGFGSQNQNLTDKFSGINFDE